MFRRRGILETIEFADAVADAQVAHRQHVGAAHAEHQEHVGGPGADAFDRREFGDHFVVAERIHVVKLHLAVHDVLRQIQHICALGS
ncbi:MAG: hypothetical protein WDN27_02240 [Candidatus Saccharibacteria bacterium]